jgi:hypothetical protein
MIFPARTLGPLARTYRAADPNADLKALVQLYLKCDETSDGSAPVTRVDSGPSLLDFADNNNIPSGTGKVYANSASLQRANSEYLYHADDPALRGGAQDFTVEMWCKPNGLVSGSMLIGKGGTAGFSEYQVYNSNSALPLTVYFGNGVNSETGVNSGFVFTDGVWFHMLFWYDTADGKGYVQVNGGTPTSATIATTAGSATGLAIGRLGDYTASNLYSSALYGPVAKYSGVLTASQRSRLWNGGAGLALY